MFTFAVVHIVPNSASFFERELTILSLLFFKQYVPSDGKSILHQDGDLFSRCSQASSNNVVCFRTFLSDILLRLYQTLWKITVLRRKGLTSFHKIRSYFIMIILR